MGSSAWLGLWVLLGVGLGPYVPHWLGLWLGLGVAIVGVGIVCRWPRVAAVAGLCLGIGAVQLPGSGPVIRGAAAIHGRVVAAPVGRTVDIGLYRVGTADGGWRTESGRVRLRVDGRAPTPGTEVMAWGYGHRPDADVLPGAAHPVRGSRWSGVRTEVHARRWDVVGGQLRRRLPPGDHGGVLHALAWGDKTAVDGALLARFRRTGTVHLLAISGFHVGLVALVVGGIVDRLLRWVALLRPVGWPRGLAWAAGAAAGLAYAGFAGAPVGAVRAALVVAIIAGVRGLGGRPQPLAVLLVVGAAVAVMDPGALLGPSFQLSFGAVLGLVRLMPTALAWRPRWWPRWLTWVWTSAAATVCATVGTLPALGWWFQELAVWPVVANLVAVPVVSFVLVPLASVHALGPAGLDPWVGWLNDGVVDGLLWTLGWVDWPPVAVALTPAGALALAGALLAHRREVWVLAVLVATVRPATPVSDGVRLTFADVGAGSAVLVEFDDGRRWLVDGGPRPTAVLAWLRRRGVRRLDVVAASQGRGDHARGLVAVVESLDVGEVWIPPGSRHDPDLVPLVAAALAREVAVIPDPPANLAADARAHLRSEADRGLALAIQADGWAVLLPSDLSPAALEPVRRAMPAPLAAVAMPQHGSRRGARLDWLAQARPAVVVAQSGRWTRYPLPHAEAEEAWRRRGARVFRTDLDGTVELTLAGDVAQVRTWHWRRGWSRQPPVPLRADPWLRAGSYPALELTSVNASSASSSSNSSSRSSSRSSSSSSSSSELRDSMNK